MPDSFARMFESVWTAVVGVIAAGFIWLVRRVVTSQREIEMTRNALAALEARINRDASARDKARDEDRQTMRDIQADIKTLLARRG